MQASFGGVQKFVAYASTHATSTCQILLVGNKTDLNHERTVSEEEAKVYFILNY